MTAAILIDVSEEEVAPPARRAPHLRGEPGAHLPRRVRPSEGGGRLRHRRRQADRPRRRQARGDQEPPRAVRREDEAPDRLLRGAWHPQPRRRQRTAGSRSRSRSTGSSRRCGERKRRGCETDMYRGMIIRKTSEQIDAMAEAGKIQARCLRMLRSKARPGVTTEELDEAAEKFIRSQGAVPSFKGYRGFPGSICTSPNSMVVHGIPGPTSCGAATSSPSTWASPTRAGSPTLRSRSRSAMPPRVPSRCSPRPRTLCSRASRRP